MVVINDNIKRYYVLGGLKTQKILNTKEGLKIQKDFKHKRMIEKKI